MSAVLSLPNITVALLSYKILRIVPKLPKYNITAAGKALIL
jgi:hypothetical protein